MNAAATKAKPSEQEGFGPEAKVEGFQETPAW